VLLLRLAIVSGLIKVILNLLCQCIQPHLSQNSSESGPGLWFPPSSQQPSLENSFSDEVNLVRAILRLNFANDIARVIVKETDTQFTVLFSDLFNNFDDTSGFFGKS
jgi:hypothetical protein